MDLGVERAGFHHKGFFEFDKQIAQSLTKNRPAWSTLFDGDVHTAARELRPENLGLERGQLDLIVGGPPCQPFSSASQWAATGRQGMLDARAQTIYSVLDLIQTLEPRVVMLENVSGFVSGTRAALPVIQQRLAAKRTGGARYEVHWQAVDAADFGVPQHRRRVIVIIAREDVSWEFKPVAVDHRTAWDAIGDLWQREVPEPSGKWASLLPSIPEGSNYQWLTAAGGGEEVFGYRTKYWHFLLKLAKDRPSWTLAASPGPSTGPFHWSNRPLSVREAARLQSFPDDWMFSGSDRLQLKQVGNATPPLLAETLALQLREALDPDFVSAGPSLLRAKAAQTPPPEPVHPIAPSYLEHVGAKAAHAGVGLGPGARRPAAR